MCIPPSDPSYAEALTFCGTMVETPYPTGLSPPSDLPSITDPIDLHVRRIRTLRTDIHHTLPFERIRAHAYPYDS